MSNAIKVVAARVADVVPANGVRGLKKILGILETAQWLKRMDYRGFPRFATRDRLYDIVLREAGEKRTLYLEFGVWEGAATRWWAKRLKHSETRLLGFDTFEGLPETWNDSYQKGHFSVGGNLPQIDDPRVSFHKGLFSETLPRIDLPPHDLLVLNMDADLYSSTKYVLDALRDRIPVGSYIYFDEFSDADHELRAFDEFVSETGYRFDLLGMTTALRHAVFRRVG